MFTGIITNVGSIIDTESRNDVRRIAVASDLPVGELAVGASIACNGICLTIATCSRVVGGETVFEVDAARETLDLTTAAKWDIGGRINLERPLKLGDELSGHMVTGHIDGVATIVERDDLGETTRFRFDSPGPLARLIAEKGSVALDGTSLTVNAVSGTQFDCLLIPHTLHVTTWNERRVGQGVNLEVDMVARYLARLTETM